MSSFGAQAISLGDSSFGAQAVYWGDPSFGAQAVSMGDSSFGAQSVYLGDSSFGAKAVYLGGCFPKSEFVYTSPDTYVPIGSLKVGDKISSWDTECKKMKYTAVTKIHKYIVMDIICFNNVMQVSFTHPLMVIEKNGIPIPKWKVAYDVRIGDCVIGVDGKLSIVKSKKKYRYDSGINVLNLSTDSGTPFFVGNFAVRADNAQDNIEWADTPITQTLIA